MKPITVTAHYERKLNTGDYSSVTLGTWITIELEEGDLAADALAHGMELCRDAVKDAATPFRKNGQPAAVDPVAAFVARVQSSPAVAAISFKNGRLTDWVKFVTGGKFDPAHADYLAEVLDRYCSAVEENGNAHTKAAADKAKADYEAGLAALVDEATPAPLFTDDDTAHTAALATAQGQMD